MIAPSSLDATLQVPWLVPAAIEWLDRELKPTFRVFEWGAGGSTFWYARRVETLISVEHDPEWYHKVLDALEAAEITNVWLNLFLPHSGECEFEDYVTSIAQYQDGFDFIAVDGRQRVRCIAAAIPKLKPGGILLLDNAERPEYAAGVDLLAGWERLDFQEDWLTSIFIKPKETL